MQYCIERHSRRKWTKRRFRKVFKGAAIRQVAATDNCARTLGGRYTCVPCGTSRGIISKLLFLRCRRSLYVLYRGYVPRILSGCSAQGGIGVFYTDGLCPSYSSWLENHCSRGYPGYIIVNNILFYLHTHFYNIKLLVKILNGFPFRTCGRTQEVNVWQASFAKRSPF